MSAIFVTGLVGLSKITRRVGFSFSNRSMAAQILDRQQGMRDAELGQQVLHDVACGPVRFDEKKHVIARLAQRQQARGYGCNPRARQQAVVPALQPRTAGAAIASRSGCRYANR